MFGGYGTNGCDGQANFCGATWEYEGTTWTQTSPSTSPSPRQFPAMAYDSDRHLVVLFGGSHHSISGCDGSSTEFCDGTWEYDGSTWTRRVVAGPSARDGAMMVYDSRRKKMVLFGGESPQIGCDDSSANLCGGTWEYDGTLWTRNLQPQQQAVHPLPRVGAAMAFDSNRDKVVLFGGSYGNGIHPLSETWSYDGSAWTQLSPSVSPPPHAGHVMAVDSSRARVVLIGGLTAPPNDSIYDRTW